MHEPYLLRTLGLQGLVNLVILERVAIKPVSTELLVLLVLSDHFIKEGLDLYPTRNWSQVREMSLTRRTLRKPGMSMPSLSLVTPLAAYTARPLNYMM
jgi:hypothetical protein